MEDSNCALHPLQAQVSFFPEAPEVWALQFSPPLMEERKDNLLLSTQLIFLSCYCCVLRAERLDWGTQTSLQWFRYRPYIQALYGPPSTAREVHSTEPGVVPWVPLGETLQITQSVSQEPPLLSLPEDPTIVGLAPVQGWTNMPWNTLPALMFLPKGCSTLIPMGQKGLSYCVSPPTHIPHRTESLGIFSALRNLLSDGLAALTQQPPSCFIVMPWTGIINLMPLCPPLSLLPGEIKLSQGSPNIAEALMGCWEDIIGLAISSGDSSFVPPTCG